MPGLKDRPYYEQSRAERRALRAEYNARRKANPKFFKQMRKLSTAQLRAMESEILESEIRRIRLLPGFRSNPELQKQVAEYEYSLRLNIEGEFWSNWKRPRKQVPRYRSRHDPKPAVEPSVPVIAPLAWGPEMPMPTAPSALAPAEPTTPETDQTDAFHSKFFNTPRHPYDSW